MIATILLMIWKINAFNTGAKAPRGVVGEEGTPYSIPRIDYSSLRASQGHAHDRSPVPARIRRQAREKERRNTQRTPRQKALLKAKERRYRPRIPPGIKKRLLFTKPY